MCPFTQRTLVHVPEKLPSAVSFALQYSSLAMHQHNSSAQEHTMMFAMIATCHEAYVVGLCDVLAQQSTIVARRVWQLPSPR